MKNKSPFFEKNKIIENDYAFAIDDGFAISKGHSLVIPKKEVSSIFNLNKQEYDACFSLVSDLKKYLTDKHQPDGFNIGVNDGESAGQTISHAHIHVIPRYMNDIDNPRGGVRNILPDSSGYKEDALQVVAGIIEKDGKILIARRSPDKDLGGLWEYAGGKIEENETDKQSLARELKEEFNIDVEVKNFLINNIHKYPKRTINLKAYKVRYISGEFKLSDHDEIAWVDISELDNYNFAPADIPINNYLKKNGI